MVDASIVSVTAEDMSTNLKRLATRIKQNINAIKSKSQMNNVKFRIVVYGKRVSTIDHGTLMQNKEIPLDNEIGKSENLQAAFKNIQNSFTDKSLSALNPTLIVLFQMNELTPAQRQESIQSLDELRQNKPIKLLLVGLESNEDELGLTPLMKPDDKMTYLNSDKNLYQVVPMTSSVLASFKGKSQMKFLKSSSIMLTNFQLQRR